MEEYKTLIENRFAYFGSKLLAKVIETSLVKTFPPSTELVKEGQYIKYVPIVLKGLLKVFTRIEDKELLLYYIQPEQSCIMSFSSSFHHEPSKIVALTEETSTVLLMPSEQVAGWVSEYPAMNTLFYKQYDLRYSELIDTINHLLYHRLDKRIMDYLLEKMKLNKHPSVKVSHKEIAKDLGTAREVVSRLIKKLEKQGQLIQHPDHIEIIKTL
ncbi:MAG: Crp/Fnr family transcriptional regulator [Bacteroidia bacterium]|jgi:CRP/FNR family transcriptional regulator|nr:Crp/Fnr family transcriptional regulator [Bacteroidia bacterium]